MSEGIILHYQDGSSRKTSHSTPTQRQQIKRTRELLFPVGTRVQLTALCQNDRPGAYDDRQNLPPGSTGTVSGTPDAEGSLPINWDHGSSLAATADDWITPIEGVKVDDLTL